MGFTAMVSYVSASIKNEELSTLSDHLLNLQKSSLVPTDWVKASIVQGWEKTLDDFLEDNLVSEDEEKKLSAFKEHLNLSQDELDKNGRFTTLVKNAILRDIVNGKLPKRITLSTPLPFNLQKGESLIWAFPSTKCYQQVSRREYIGKRSGCSIRIAKGIYYRTSAFRGTPIVTTEMSLIDTGVLGVTQKHIYFLGQNKSHRIPYKKVVSFVPCSDGFGVHRDGVSSKPQFFGTGDGWFSYNLLTNIAAEELK